MSLDHCPTCSRRIKDGDMTGREASDGQRWCLGHAPNGRLCADHECNCDVSFLCSHCSEDCPDYAAEYAHYAALYASGALTREGLAEGWLTIDEDGNPRLTSGTTNTR